MSKCEIRVYYKGLEKNKALLYKWKISQFKTYEELKNTIIEKSHQKDMKIEIKNIAVTKKDKFILEIEGKIPGLDSVFNEKTFEFLINKLNETKATSIKVYIDKVKEYPNWEPPKIYEILKNTLTNASSEVFNSIKKDLPQEELDNGGRIFIKEKKEEKVVDDENYHDMHVCVFCQNCHNGNFFGLRYICAECNNYNLCENCFSNEVYSHDKEHTFIRIKIPMNQINMEINNYSCIFTPNRRVEYQKYGIFEIETEVINNGRIDLLLCFISPVRFGKKYLGCNRASVLEHVNSGEKYKIKMIIKFEDENEEPFEPLKKYEGYFRLMTQEGIPFGDILYLQVNIQE